MKTANSKTASQKLAGIVESLRLRVETAESRRRAAKEQVRVAKLRRKEAKLVARRARKQAKQAKAGLAKARKSLAEAEAKLVDSGVRQATRKLSKAKARAKRVGNPSVPVPNPGAVTGRKGPSSRPPVASLARRAAVEVAPASLRENTPSPAPAQAGSATGKPDSGPLQPAVTGGTTSSDMRTK